MTVYHGNGGKMNNRFLPRRKFVVIIDDEVDLACLFKEALSIIPNIHTLAFSDPVLALEHFQINHSNYKCIVSDYRMPGLNGMELLKRVKEIDEKVVRILFSAFEPKDGLFESSGCVDKFLQKPIRIGDLVSCVETYVNPLVQK